MMKLSVIVQRGYFFRVFLNALVIGLATICVSPIPILVLGEEHPSSSRVFKQKK